MQFQSINNKTENEVLIDPTVSNQNSCVHPNEIQSGYTPHSQACIPPRKPAWECHSLFLIQKAYAVPALL